MESTFYYAVCSIRGTWYHHGHGDVAKTSAIEQAKKFIKAEPWKKGHFEILKLYGNSMPESSNCIIRKQEIIAIY